MAVVDMLDSARTLAELATIAPKDGRTKRLYKVLADCKNIVELCETLPQAMIELKHLHTQQGHNGNRRYIEKKSDAYTLVCRYVFEPHTDRANAYRYSQALRQAGERKIGSQQLEQWLLENGGVNSLYFSRPLKAQMVMMKSLLLSRSVPVPRDREFELTLRWRNNNTFEVVAQKRC